MLCPWRPRGEQLKGKPTFAGLEHFGSHMTPLVTVCEDPATSTLAELGRLQLQLPQTIPGEHHIFSNCYTASLSACSAYLHTLLASDAVSFFTI